MMLVEKETMAILIRKPRDNALSEGTDFFLRIVKINLSPGLIRANSGVYFFGSSIETRR